jgi:hypothetical protein
MTAAMLLPFRIAYFRFLLNNAAGDCGNGRGPKAREFQMAKYLYVYHGGGSMPQSKEEIDKVMQAWGGWFGSLGAAVVDGGNPVRNSATVKSGSVTKDGGANPATGYSIIEASSQEDAVAKAKGCPILTHGGSIEVAEIIPM